MPRARPGPRARPPLELARGPLLPDEPDAEWAEAERALPARLELDARRSGAEAALDAGDHAGAALLAQGALDHDPFDEVLVRTLMRGLAGSGRPASALAAYAALRDRLVEELGVSPTPETEELHTAILLAPPDEVGRPAAPRPAPRCRPGATCSPLSTPPWPVPRPDAAAWCWWRARPGWASPACSRCGVPRRGPVGRRCWRGAARSSPRSLPLQPVLAALDDHLAALDPDGVAAALGPDAEVLAPFLGRSAERAGSGAAGGPARPRRASC